MEVSRSCTEWTVPLGFHVTELDDVLEYLMRLIRVLACGLIQQLCIEIRRQAKFRDIKSSTGASMESF